VAQEFYCVDPSRDAYKGKVPVEIVADVVWFDDGYQRAFKGDVVDFNAKDAAIYKNLPSVKFVGS